MKILVTGATGLVGAEIVRQLDSYDKHHVLTPGRERLDCRSPTAVFTYLQRECPQHVYVAAGTVGGIVANDRAPYTFGSDNLAIALALIDGAVHSDVERLLYLGSSCIYPRAAPQPIAEEALLGGPLEETNAPYAVAKIAGLTLCSAANREHGTDFRALMPTNLYGPGDHFDERNGHVVPALIRRFHTAKTQDEPAVLVLGSGAALRELLYVDDLADACICVMDLTRAKFHGAAGPAGYLNVGSGEEVSIRDLAHRIADLVGYRGKLLFTGGYEGTPRKRLDTTRMDRLGWRARTRLDDGLERTYASFLYRQG